MLVINCSLLSISVQCHAVERVLKAFRDPFIKSIDANAVIQELQHADTISDGDVEEIKQIKDATQQSARLHKMLEDKCTADAFMEFCDMVSSVKGNRRMKGLGKNMKKQLECKCLYLIECLHVAMQGTGGYGSMTFSYTSHSCCKRINDALIRSFLQSA